MTGWINLLGGMMGGGDGSVANPLMQAMQAGNPGALVGDGAAGQMMAGIAQALEKGGDPLDVVKSTAAKAVGLPIIPRGPVEWASALYILDKIPFGLNFWRQRLKQYLPGVDHAIADVYDAPKHRLNEFLAEKWNEVLDKNPNIKAPQLDSRKVETLLSAGSAAMLMDNVADFFADMLTRSNVAKNEQLLMLAAHNGIDLSDSKALSGFISSQINQHGASGLVRHGFQLAAVAAGVLGAFESDLVKTNIPGINMLTSFSKGLLGFLKIGQLNEFIAGQLYTETMSSPETLVEKISTPDSGTSLDQLLQMKQMVEQGKVRHPSNNEIVIEVPKFVKIDDPWLEQEQAYAIHEQNQQAAAWQLLSSLDAVRKAEGELLKTNNPQAFVRLVERFVIEQIDAIAQKAPWPGTVDTLNNTLTLMHSQMQDPRVQELFGNILNDMRTAGRDIRFLHSPRQYGTDKALDRLTLNQIPVGEHAVLGDDSKFFFYPPLGLTDRSVTLPEGQKPWEAGGIVSTAATAPRAAASPFAGAMPHMQSAASQDPDLAIAMMVLQLGSQREGGLSVEERALVERVLNKKPTAQDTAISEVKATENAQIADQQLGKTTGGELRAITDETTIGQASSEGALIAAQQTSAPAHPSL